MTNSFTPTRYGSIRQPDLFSDRNIVSGREPSTPNQFFTETVKGHPEVVQWTLVINSLDEGLGRVRGQLASVLARVQGQTSGAPLDTRYPDSLHLPTLRRNFSTPSLTSTAPTAPSFRADSSATNTNDAPTATAPTGMAAGDVVIVTLVWDDASTSVDSVPSGWSLLQQSDPGSTGDFVMETYYKVVNAADVSAGTFAWSLTASERWRAYAAAFQNGVAPSASAGELVRAATRFYLPSSGAAPISPSFSSDWDVTTGALRLAASTTKQLTPSTVAEFFDSNSSDKDILLRQYVVSTPLAAQTISAQTVKVQLFGSGSAAGNMFVAWAVKVVSSAGALRGVVVAHNRDNTELTDTTQNRGDSATSTQVIAQAGDYLVFEFGAGGNPDSGGDHDVQLYFGDAAASDLPENDTETSVLNPWIEFANAISFEGASAEIEVTAPVTRPESLVFSITAVDEDARTFTGVTDSGETLTEREDSASGSVSLASYSESVTALGNVTHTITRSAGTSDIASHMVVIPPASFGKRISHVNLFGKHAIAQGQNLYRETQDGTYRLESLTYSPGSAINGLFPLIVGGATADTRVAVCRTDDPIQLLDDLASTPSVNGTAMHTDTEPAWGIIQTILVGTVASPEDDILIYANNAIRSMSRTEAIGTQPAITLGNVPNGGGALGEIQLPGAPYRAYWLFPIEDCGTSQARVNNIPCKVVSTNLFGDDPQDLEVPLWTASGDGNRSYAWACIWQQGIVVSDMQRIVFHNGRNNILSWPGERPGLGDNGQLFALGGWVKGSQLVILVQRVALQGGTGNTLYWLEEYDENTGRFHQISAVVDEGSVGAIVGSDAIGSFPVSPVTDMMHWHDGTEWNHILLTDPLRNPAVHLDGTTGAGAHWAFEASGTVTSPEIILPGLGKVPSVISEVHFIGDVDAGGTGSTVTIEVASQDRNAMTFTKAHPTAEFHEGDRWEKQHIPFPDNQSAADRLMYRITAARGADSNHTPQGVPVMIKGLAFLDGRVRTPLDVLGEDWLRQFA